MPKESWKVIAEHPNYQVSSLGNVRNIRTNKLLTPYNDGTGYYRVCLDGKCLRLHILVAKAFLPNPDNKPTVNHIRGNKKDNRASQLEWATYSEQQYHVWQTGLRKRRKRYAKGKTSVQKCTPERAEAHA